MEAPDGTTNNISAEKRTHHHGESSDSLLLCFVESEDGGSRLEEPFQDEALEDDPSLHLPSLERNNDAKTTLSVPTPDGASDLIDLSDGTSNGDTDGADTFHTHLPDSPPTWNGLGNWLNGWSTIKTQQKPHQDIDDHDADIDAAAVRSFRTSPLARSRTGSDYYGQLTIPRPCRTPEPPEMLPGSQIGSGRFSSQQFSLSAPASPMSPMSKVSLRTTRSETYYHTYEEDRHSPPAPVPPFVVVHNAGHAFVKITPQRAAPDEKFTDEDQQSTTSSLVSWRSWCLPIVMLVAGAFVLLGSVTVAAGLIKARQINNNNTSTTNNGVPTAAPVVEFPTREPFLDPDRVSDGETEGAVVKVPYEETGVPTEATTRPPRTFAPTEVLEDNEGGDDTTTEDPSPSPSSLEDDTVPWNNYVLGLLTRDSPDTFQELDDPNSPQYKALRWLSMDMSQQNVISYDQESSLQRYGLVCLWFATSGSSSWTKAESWLEEQSNECDWDGVVCDDSNIVVGLSLPNNGLKGSIPLEISLLTNLQALVLSQNMLQGSLSASLAKIAELVDLNVSSNGLTGSLPEQFGGLDLLRSLDVSHNGLRGTIPPAIGSMANLEVLNLCDNAFTGVIPDQIGSLSFLQTVNLGRNDGLFGTVPDTICDLGSVVGRSSPPDVIVNCLVECACCVSCCDQGVQPRSMQECCTM